MVTEKLGSVEYVKEVLGVVVSVTTEWLAFVVRMTEVLGP